MTYTISEKYPARHKVNKTRDASFCRDDEIPTIKEAVLYVGDERDADRNITLIIHNIENRSYRWRVQSDVRP